jgi:two-component system sensor histidine kinase ResE
MHYLPILDALGNPIAVEGILRDITERKKIEENLGISETARRELVENISHELRTPITLIQGYLESLLNNVVPAASVQSCLKMVHSKTLMINSLLEDLIQASQFTSQTLEYKFYELNALEYFSNLIAQTEFQTSRSGLNFFSQNDLESSATVIIDPSRIEQVVSNLISNSIRHTPGGGSLSVECTAHQEEHLSDGSLAEDHASSIPCGEIVFSVTDTGEGVHPDDLPHLFERGFQGRNKLGSQQSGGAGLGLYISLQIMKQHSGRMWAKQNPGGGTTISFSIPYYRILN